MVIQYVIKIIKKYRNHEIMVYFKLQIFAISVKWVTEKFAEIFNF